MELVVKEAICKPTTPASSHFSHNGVYDIPSYWITTYKKLRGGTQAGHTHQTAL